MLTSQWEKLHVSEQHHPSVPSVLRPALSLSASMLVSVIQDTKPASETGKCTADEKDGNDDNAAANEANAHIVCPHEDNCEMCSKSCAVCLMNKAEEQLKESIQDICRTHGPWKYCSCHLHRQVLRHCQDI